MTLLDSLKQNSTVTNTKGSKYYNTSYNFDIMVLFIVNNKCLRIV